MKAWSTHDQDTTLFCCRALHVKHAAYASALYTLIHAHELDSGEMVDPPELQYYGQYCGSGGSTIFFIRNEFSRCGTRTERYAREREDRNLLEARPSTLERRTTRTEQCAKEIASTHVLELCDRYSVALPPREFSNIAPRDI
ncbi:unnamed protein product [Pieris macdunnoughi]|uniref:Uncharacterized protein n=1 Tax=Pieris macdunnoughi TaxID=345717 RepID=A0A821UT67_9NEOP|nr:unnamed protein product [Pieris macdunnoughi]